MPPPSAKDASDQPGRLIVVSNRIPKGDVPAGGSVVVRSATGYSRRFDPAELDGVLLAHAMAGAPLPPDLGAPLRLVVPGRRGFWWVKWVVAVESDDRPPWWQPAFPLQ